jgi:hypothetical protein
MKKVMISALVVGLCITANLMAQVPNYVPTNGLVGWWPFNGNANDESGNGNNGTNNGATLTTDRFGNTDKAYDFDGVNDLIEFGDIQSLNNSNAFTVSVFFNYNNLPSFPNDWYTVVADGSYADLDGWGILIKSDQILMRELDNFNGLVLNYNFSLNNWYHITATCESDSIKLFINGQFLGGNLNLQPNLTLNTSNAFRVGNGTMNNVPPNSHPYYFSGKIDDIGLWNRALSDCEIIDLYNSQINSVSGSISVSPQPATIGSSVLLSTASQTQNFQWQTAPAALNWQNVPNNTNYSGGTSNTLTVSNVQLSNHNQPFRIIANAGNCTDTSNIATIQISDTCITNVTVYDTLLTTVTDTLIINTTLSLPSPNNENTILIYPNPASDHITIDNGNFSAMAGYTIRIENNAGQQVFQSLINQAQFYVDLSTWTGNGLYFVHLIDPQNNTVTVRKIVLQ